MNGGKDTHHPEGWNVAVFFAEREEGFPIVPNQATFRGEPNETVSIRNDRFNAVLRQAIFVRKMLHRISFHALRLGVDVRRQENRQEKTVEYIYFLRHGKPFIC